MSITWTETAAGQLEAIRDYFARSSIAFAQTLIARIIARADSLADYPLVGAEVAEYGEPTIREMFEHPYRILYQVSGPDVRVIAIIHSARRLPRSPPG